LRPNLGNTPLIFSVQGFENRGGLACVMGSLADAYLESTPLGSAKWLPECVMGFLEKSYPGTMAKPCMLCKGLCGMLWSG
jgi:hypothetical protein